MIGNKKAFFALALLSVAACSAKTEENIDQTAANAGNTIENGAMAAGNAIENVAQDLTLTPSGQAFADTAAKSDAFEIAAAKLVASNGQSAEVKAFAKMMISAHTESTAAIRKAASEAQPVITPDPKLTSEQDEDLAELGALKGAEFDKAYVDGQVEAHEDALSLMKKYAADGTVPSLKAAAGAIAPVVEKHLAQAKLLDKD
jgi:putative membrane protein